MARRLFGAAALALALFASGCANGMTSDYAKLGQKTVYEYATFCGPSLPRTTLPRLSDEKRLFLVNTPAEDSIDTACKTHDVCFEFYAHDNFFCDQAILGYLAPGVGARPERPVSASESTLLAAPLDNWAVHPANADSPRGQCPALAREIFNGIYMKTRSTYGGAPGLEIVASAMMGVGHVLNAPLRLLENNSVGFPSRSGLCHLTTSAEAFSRREAALNVTAAAMAYECGCALSYRRSGSYLAGGSCTRTCRATSAAASSTVVGALFGDATKASLATDRSMRDMIATGFYRELQ